MRAGHNREPAEPAGRFCPPDYRVSPTRYRQLEARNSAYRRQRGNVETELARLDNDAAGCGCAYPATVSDREVQWSNTIMARLARVAGAAVGDEAVSNLSVLPMVGLWQPAQDLAVINNDSAGMANSRGNSAGINSRIAAEGASHPPVSPLYWANRRGAQIAALPVRFDLEQWLKTFGDIWPANSAASASYLKTMTAGPDYDLVQAARGGFTVPGNASLRSLTSKRIFP